MDVKPYILSKEEKPEIEKVVKEMIQYAHPPALMKLIKLSGAGGF